MKYVIIRDDDTNALTSPELLEELYRPFLDRGMAVHLSTIPLVRTDLPGPHGGFEGFLMGNRAGEPGLSPIHDHTALVDYILHESAYEVLQHGLSHEFVKGTYEFAQTSRVDIIRRLELGRQILLDAGFPLPHVFVAPQDQLSRISLKEVAQRFRILSTGAYWIERMPSYFWPQYLWSKKVRGRPYWSAQGTVFLTHPGCILSYHRPIESILQTALSTIASQRITVIVSHHWEYYVEGRNQPFIDILHALAEELHRHREIKVIRFENVVDLV